MVLYPISAYAQEIAFRTFFFHRYAVLFPRPATRVIASGLIFGWAHVAVNNVTGILLATTAGLAIAVTYERRRSTLLVTLEHALYGDLAFTAGLGALFYSKARWFAGFGRPGWTRTAGCRSTPGELASLFKRAEAANRRRHQEAVALAENALHVVAVRI